MRIKHYALAGALACLPILLLGLGLAKAQGGDPKRGADLYAANCAVCHGPQAQGRIGANLRDFSSIDTTTFLETTIADGVSGTRMPAWSQAKGGPLGDQDIADIAAYVVGLIGGSEPVAPAPTFVPPAITPAPGVTGDPSAGALVFAQNCAVCHGDRGQGRIGATLAKNWPSINPAAYIRSTVENGVEGSLMPAWLDTNGGPLTKTDIDNASAFILSLNQQTVATSTPAPTSGNSPLIGAGLIGLIIVGVLVVAVIITNTLRKKNTQ